MPDQTNLRVADALSDDQMASLAQAHRPVGSALPWSAGFRAGVQVARSVAREMIRADARAAEGTDPITPQQVCDELAEVLPRRMGIFEARIDWQTGSNGPRCAIRARIGTTPPYMREIAGLGENPSDALANLINRASEVDL